MIDYTRIRLTGALNINHLYALELHVGINNHGWAVVEGEAEENALEQLQNAVAGREQVILVRDESGTEQPLFAGIIHTADLITYGGYNRFRIELQTGTIQMDQVKRSRSFQDTAQTYSQVAQQIADGYDNGAVIPTIGLDKSLDIPVIQYRETDWEFLKRIASWCNGVIVPESHYSYPRIWFGFPERSFTCTFSEDCYTSGISQRYYELGGAAAGYNRVDFLYYDVPSGQLRDLGWHTVFKGQEFLICEKWAKLEHGELRFTYRLGKPGLGWGRKQYNDKISGMTILGEVISAERETVRLKLDIDKNWEPGGPYAYTWRPETGNMMYCMPQVGTQVSLYFPNYDEQSAMVVNCVRTNGGSCNRMSDPSKRSFVTEHGKELNLYPEEMSFIGGTTGAIKLLDEAGISFSTGKKIRILAISIQMFGQTVSMSVPIGDLILAKANTQTGIISAMVQSFSEDLYAKRFSFMEGEVSKELEEIHDELRPEKSDHKTMSQIIGNAIVGIAVVACLTIVGVVAAAIAGVAMATIGGVAACVMGITVIGTVSNARKDAKNNEARSVDEAILDSISWGLDGLLLYTGGKAILGLANIGNVAPYIGKLSAAEMAKTILGTGLAVGSGSGALDVLIQLLNQFIKNKQLDIGDIDWDSVENSTKNGFVSGLFAGSGLGWEWQMIFNAALNARSAQKDGENIWDILISGIVGGSAGKWGGAGILAGNIAYKEILGAIKMAAAYSTMGNLISEFIQAVEEFFEEIKEKYRKENEAIPQMNN